MKNILLSLAFLCLSILSTSAAKSGKLLLVENGKSQYRIVVSANADPTVSSAAELLQEYLKKISGAVVPIVKDSAGKQSKEILVGFSNRTDDSGLTGIREKLDPDGFQIITEGKKLYFLGGSHMGTTYAVVDFLETQLACRKYSPGSEEYPALSTIEINPVNKADHPVCTFRVMYGNFSRDEKYKNWQRLDNVEDVFADGYYVHTLGRLIPWEKYFASHPEYFAYLNGKRIIDQPCLSNPDVLKITLDQLKAEMEKQPGKKLWSVSQNDNFSYCQCPDCKRTIEEEGSPAGPIIRFVNKVADAFPDKLISTLAYQYSRQAPKVTKPRENVQIMLCTIELNRAKSIETDISSKSFLQDIVDWGKISKHIYLWDYTVNFSNHVSPFPNLHVLQPNIQFFVKNGALEHFQQSNTDYGHEFSELKNYLIARLLWNPDVNADSVMNQFLEGYYGAAGHYIREYIDLLQDEYIRSGQVLDIYGSPVWNANGALSVDNMAIYNYLFDKAEKAVSLDKELTKRVRTARLPIQFAAMEIGKNDMFGSRGWYVENNGKFILRPKMKATLEAFNAGCKAGNVKTLSEAGLTPEEYYKSTLRFIDVQIDKNLAFRKKTTATPLPSSKYSNGDLANLTNGVQGANDYKVHWLGWEAKDFEITVDLEKVVSPSVVRIGTLYDPKSWILHPTKVACSVSADGVSWKDAGTIEVTGDQKKEDVNRNFEFRNNLANCRYIKFAVTGTKSLPIWHPSAGGDSWVFVDEIVVE